MTELELSIKSYFGIIDAEELSSIASLFQLELLKKGDYFLNTNKECDRLSFVQSGFLRIFFETEDKEVTQWISTKGYFVTDLSGFIFNQPARWTIQALTDVEIYTIRKSEYEKIKIIIPRWPELERLFIVRCFTTLEDRIFSHLSMTAEERYHFFFENNKELFNQVPLQYIASMLGMRPETFSRIRKKQLS
ncbi:Crp/Fnr family transcriptional regulator [Elizabethkingia anophelis]|uniref:Crp/Fnr family transcriptional regulator n=1 Tax=Elizabethkingia anophelis TaxID=1117645 RepID=UPI00161F8FBE|nr:Crp/Fnr family transcriptional regulator [Elizabethkingia anophelis]MBG0506322.1 Crp/Fnr family transcriptional regulator [Elizabethkingia anophelis]MCT4072558.1 Crp/Fnr family transcriptional regulator [Elizabethkingia anophelis]